MTGVILQARAPETLHLGNDHMNHHATNDELPELSDEGAFQTRTHTTMY